MRPAAFTNGPASGPASGPSDDGYRHGFAPTERDLTLKVPRADVAAFMLRQLGDDGYLHQSPGLSR